MKSVTTRTADISLDKNEIVIIKIINGISMDYEDAADNFLVVKHLTENRRSLKLIDARENHTINKKARQFIEGKDVKDKTRVRAIVVNSATKKLLLNFYYSLDLSKAPAKVFTDYDEAYRWLLTFKIDTDLIF